MEMIEDSGSLVGDRYLHLLLGSWVRRFSLAGNNQVGHGLCDQAIRSIRNSAIKPELTRKPKTKKQNLRAAFRDIHFSPHNQNPVLEPTINRIYPT